MLWSLKDSVRPVNSISTPAGITSIAWSKRTPNHIAVGLHSGIIAIYGARQKQASAPPSAVHLGISTELTVTALHHMCILCTISNSCLPDRK